MTREEQLKSCRVCQHQKFNHDLGIVCGLTDAQATFTDKCNDFVVDPLILEREAERLKNDPDNLDLAGSGKRLANYLIDLVFFYAFTFFLAIVIGVLMGIFYPEGLSFFDDLNPVIEYLFAVFSGVIFYTLFEATSGRTIAKYITKTKVVDKYGGKPSLNAIIIRSLCRFIPFNPFSFLGEPGKGWHDRLSHTRVIEI